MNWDVILYFFQVCVGLGMVIFVHELGHFMVAKMCGVKCEKFYVGFDPQIKIGPWSLPNALFKIQRGETEYGIGIIPLGGYVKMLGQDDNPAKYKEEAERITLTNQENRDPSQDTPPPDADTDEEPIELDPRSYPAKSVPQRIAIISAGVIMNLIFAVIFAAIAFRSGFEYTPCIIGGTFPGSPAWVAGLQPGDRIIQIGREGEPDEHLRFKRDLQGSVMLSDKDSELEFLVRRGEEESWYTLKPTRDFSEKHRIALIGVYAERSLQVKAITEIGRELSEEEKQSRQEDKTLLQPGDIVTSVNGHSVSLQKDFKKQLANLASEVLTLSVTRPAADKNGSTQKTIDVKISQRSIRRLGLIVGMGPITEMYRDSPAHKAGFERGDQIVNVAGHPVGDPMTLSERIRRLAGTTVEIDVQRGNDLQTLTVTPQSPRLFSIGTVPGGSVPIESLGVVFQTTNVVRAVIPNSSAQEKGLKPGDQIEQVEFIPAPGGERKEMKNIGTLNPLVISSKDEKGFDVYTGNWPHFFSLMQGTLPDTQVKVSYLRDEKRNSVTLQPIESTEWFLAARGIVFEDFVEPLQITNWGTASQLALQQTSKDLFMVLGFLKKLVTGEISPNNLGGPVTIVAVATSEASMGTGRLLLFLTMLSANLAVINFLPIPVLDGGHLVFLVAEGLRGKPVDEQLQFRLTVAGLIFILGLMVYVLGLDFLRFLPFFY